MNISKLKEKRKFIIGRLRELNLLPIDMEDATNEQKEIYNQIWELNFDYWEEVKINNGWVHTKKLTPDEMFLRDKRTKARYYLRNNNFLPQYGEPLTEEHQLIINQIENNDFSILEEVKELKKKRLKSENNTYRQNMVLVDGTERIELKNVEGYTITSEPRNVFIRLRLAGILPPIGSDFNEEQQVVVDDVNKNWFGKTKNFFISKYIHLTTPESRLFYRLHKSHRELGYRFNITVDDIVIPERCPLLDIPLSTDPKDRNEPNYYTGDRIDSSKGVVKGNIQVISLRANKMKNKATELQLLTFATNGLKMLKDV